MINSFEKFDDSIHYKNMKYFLTEIFEVKLVPYFVPLLAIFSISKLIVLGRILHIVLYIKFWNFIKFDLVQAWFSPSETELNGEYQKCWITSCLRSCRTTQVSSGNVGNNLKLCQSSALSKYVPNVLETKFVYGKPNVAKFNHKKMNTE